MRRLKSFLPHLLFLSLIALLSASHAYALDIRVKGPEGEDVSGFRWLVEEDATYRVEPGVVDPETLAVKFNASYMPVIAQGHGAASVSVALDGSKHHYVSILPDSGYAMGGASIIPGQSSVTITVNKHPIPTAQITVFVFEDNSPINNAPDLPEERGLEGFSVLIHDAAGRYGQAGGQVSKDAFGNPLGTTYNADGSTAAMGSGVIKTDADGNATIKYLPPGKYGLVIVPPSGDGWVQTSTIEGTKTIDAWVKANEPAYFMEFGPPGWHVFAGFVKEMQDSTALTGNGSITGQVVNMHLSRPPDYAFYDGGPFEHTTPWIGLNSLSADAGKGIFAKRANADGTFSIPGVPPGDYQLVVWDDNLDLIIALLGVTVPPGGGEVALGDVPVFQWFTRLESFVFNDRNGNGFRDCATLTCDDPSVDDIGIPEVVVNLRFRDGSLYNSMPTDGEGFAPFDEVFPFFNWLVAEIDYARLKATGATVIVDAGGPIDPDQGWDYPSGGVLTPQPQFDSAGNPVINPNTGNNLSRTETGPVLLQAFQGFIGQTSRIEWGKSAYGEGENGGISGIVRYAVTRAENDPAYAAAEEWEPGIPRVQVNLYADGDVDNSPYGWREGTGEKGPEDLDRDNDGVFDVPDKAIDDVNGDGGPTLSDVDNYPFGWRDGTAPRGLEDIDRNSDGAFDAGDSIAIAITDSWDDSVPTGCQGEVFYSHGVARDCYDGLRNFNQVRPGVFDGGYAFNDIPAATYIVEAATPRATKGETYHIIREEDKNVDFGDELTPGTLLLPPACVNYDENNGQGHLVPAELALFPGVASAYAGKYRPLCDRKQITLSDDQNAAADFSFMTEVPIAAHFTGFILDDASNEFDPNSPQFGEKYAPPWLPVSVRDWTGREISRIYSDEWGVYNGLLPSTYTMNIPMPSGASPQMATLCMNDPGPIPDPAHPGQFITDPYFNRQYSQFCYTMQFMPGTTTYLDTPVVPVAAFAGPGQYPLDCEFADGTPKIYSTSGASGGPYVSGANRSLTIVSEGRVPVPNPLYDGPGGTNPRTVERDYGFGAVAGSVYIGERLLTVTAWTEGSISANVPVGTPSGELKVIRGDNGKATVESVRVTVGPITGSVISVAPGASIQAAIDAAKAGDLVLVPPGTYNELVIMWKPVQLQGWGPGSTTINAVKTPAEKLQAWRDKIAALISSNSVTLLPAQEGAAAFAEEAPGVMVLARDASVGGGGGGFGQNPNARIDGFTITGSDLGGGVFVNGYARYLEIANNRIIGNQGTFGGGIRVGHPGLVLETNDGLEYQDAENDNIFIHNNHVTQNGGLGGAGGGIALYTGADNYRVNENFVCGNFTMGEGGGIGHQGLSDNGLIYKNAIAFNQSFNQGLSVSGGGVFIGGEPGLNAGLSPGSGDVEVNANLIQGNLAGAGDGGGIRLVQTTGQDVQDNQNRPERWNRVDIFNNMIVNNVAGLAGGAISMQDAARVNILQNTIARNDSTATAGEAFAPGSPSQSTPQPAGIVSRAHSAGLKSAFGASSQVQQYNEFSNPRLANNIIWQNRSFYFIADATQDPPFYGLVPDVAGGAAPVYWDLWVTGTATQRYLNPQYSILTSTAGYPSTNQQADPLLADAYFNGASNQVIIPEITTAIQAQPAFDEGGNFIDVRFGPLGITGDYHILTGSPAINSGSMTQNTGFTDLRRDFDGGRRPTGIQADIGADEK